MTGRTVAHYEICEKLGQGGMGVVYKARDRHLDRVVAIKILPADKVADSERKRRFVQEAKAASALNHPNIITIYDIDRADGVDFIAMEYVHGKTLEQLIPRKGMLLKEALAIAVQTTRQFGISLFSPATGQRRSLTLPPKEFNRDVMPSFSPDGRFHGRRCLLAPSVG